MTTVQDPDAAERIEPYVWRIASVAVLGTIMSLLDTTIVNVALHTLTHDLHSSIARIQWVITGYLLALAVVIRGLGVGGAAPGRPPGLRTLAGAVHRGLGAVPASPFDHDAGALPGPARHRRRE